MYQVEIKFRGLCGFVPGDTGTAPPWVGVFLVDADEDSRKNFGLALARHYAFLQFQLKDLDGPTVPPNDAEDYGFWALESKDLVIVRQGGVAGPVKIHRATGPLGDFPRTGEHNFFDWVPQIDDVAPGAGAVHSDCFSNSPSGRVSVRLHLEEGTLICDALGEYEGNFVLSQFDPPRTPAPSPRAMARRTAWVMDGVTGPLKLRARKFGSTIVRDLTFKDPGVGNKLSLTILNVCMDDFVEDKERRRRYPVVDQDYRWYYTLSQTTPIPVPESLPVPVPVQYRVSTGSGGGEPAQCTSNGFKPPTSAQVSSMRSIATSIRTAP